MTKKFKALMATTVASVLLIAGASVAAHAADRQTFTANCSHYYGHSLYIKTKLSSGSSVSIKAYSRVPASYGNIHAFSHPAALKETRVNFPHAYIDASTSGAFSIWPTVTCK